MIDFIEVVKFYIELVKSYRCAVRCPLWTHSALF